MVVQTGQCNQPPDTGQEVTTAGRDSAGDGALAKLEAHLSELDEPSLLRVARAVEMARASDKRDPTDDRILDCLRPRLREIRPDRVPTFQRAVCAHLEPFLYSGPVPERKQPGAIPRSILPGWWRILSTSAQRKALSDAEADFAGAVRAEAWLTLSEPLERGTRVAAEITAELVREADLSVGRRVEMAGILGGDRHIQELREIATVLALAPKLTPALCRIRQAAGVRQGSIPDFVPAAVLAARSAYVEFHADSEQMVEYLFLALVQLLDQPWQALRLVRMLSTDLTKAGEGHLNLIPCRLFGDLTRTLSEIGRSTGGENGMSRRVWLMTCARLISDAGAMIKGLADEAQAGDDPDWLRQLGEARARVGAAVEGFSGIAVRETCLVLPSKQVKEKGSEARQEPDMAHTPSEEEVQTAQAAAMLFVACRRYAEQEGLERSFRPKEADLAHRLQIGINFRVEFLRARMRHAVCLAQLAGVAQVLKMLPQGEGIGDLNYRVERTLERFR